MNACEGGKHTSNCRQVRLYAFWSATTRGRAPPEVSASKRKRINPQGVSLLRPRWRTWTAWKKPASQRSRRHGRKHHARVHLASCNQGGECTELLSHGLPVTVVGSRVECHVAEHGDVAAMQDGVRVGSITAGEVPDTAHRSGQWICSRSMQSTPSRVRQPSTAAVMLAPSSRRGPPRSQGIAAGPATLVATVTAPTRPDSRSQRPRKRSERPCVPTSGETARPCQHHSGHCERSRTCVSARCGTGYISAESNKVTPLSAGGGQGRTRVRASSTSQSTTAKAVHAAQKVVPARLSMCADSS